MALINNISRVHVATLMCLYNKNKKFYCYQITNTNINHLCSLQNYGFEGRKQSDVCENGSFSIFPRDFFFLRLVENIVFCLKYPGKYFFFKEEKSLKLLAIYKILIYI